MTVRAAMGTGLALTLGLAFVPLGCENWDRPTFTHIHALPEGPDHREISAPVLHQIEGCARELPAPTPSEQSANNIVAFGVQVDEGGRVRKVTLGRSTLGDRGWRDAWSGRCAG